jgi:hypothetical protein
MSGSKQRGSLLLASPLMSDERMDECLKDLRTRTQTLTYERKSPVKQISFDCSGPGSRRQSMDQKLQEQREQREEELAKLNDLLTSARKKRAPIQLPQLIDLKRSSPSSLHASGAHTDRPSRPPRKALSEPKTRYEPQRASLKDEAFSAILGLGDFSDFQETRSMAPPAICALASHQMNCHMLAERGALDVMLRLAQPSLPPYYSRLATRIHQVHSLRAPDRRDFQTEGSDDAGWSPLVANNLKKQTTAEIQVRTDSWESIFEMLISPSVVKRLSEMPTGLASVMACVIDPSVRIRRLGAQILARIVLSQALPIQDRSLPHMFEALLHYAYCRDDETSFAAGRAVLGVAQAVVASGHCVDKECIFMLAEATAGPLRDANERHERTVDKLGHSAAGLHSVEGEGGKSQGQNCNLVQNQLSQNLVQNQLANQHNDQNLNQSQDLNQRRDPSQCQGQDLDLNQGQRQCLKGGGEVLRRCFGRRDLSRAISILSSDRFGVWGLGFGV